MISVSGHDHYDLWFDPNQVGGDLVVECWISHGPRALDRSFDPQPGDTLLVSGAAEAPLSARVTRREPDRVWVQVALTQAADAVA